MNERIVQSIHKRWNVTHPDMIDSQFTESSTEHESFGMEVSSRCFLLSHGDIKPHSDMMDHRPKHHEYNFRGRRQLKRENPSQSREYSTYETRDFLLNSVSTDWISISRVSSWRGGWTAVSIVVRRAGKKNSKRGEKRKRTCNRTKKGKKTKGKEKKNKIRRKKAKSEALADHRTMSRKQGQIS
jgi:hypothetical protein